MNNIESIKGAVKIFEEYKIDYALLHTTNLYPTDPKLVRLGALEELKMNFPKAVIGLSDHTTSNLACLGAVALGACILERHFTDSMDREGPDIVCSMDGVTMSKLIDEAKIMSKMRGGSKNELLEEEQATRNFAFSTVVAISDIKKGEAFSKNNIWVKRPGVGEVPARDYEKVIGLNSKRNISEGEHLKLTDY